MPPRTTASPIPRLAGAATSSIGSHSPVTRRSSTPAAVRGRVTALLAERLPRGRVVALDASPSMIEEARRRLAPVRRSGRVRGRGSRPALRAAPGVPSTRSSPPPPSIGSRTTTPSSRTSPRPPTRRGRLVAQCGGGGQHRVGRWRCWPRVGDGWLGAKHFETPEATAERLADGRLRRRRDLAPSGADPVRAGRAVRDVPPHRGARRTTSRACRRRSAMRSSPRSSRRLPEPAIDYVRLNITARRAADRRRARTTAGAG